MKVPGSNSAMYESLVRSSSRVYLTCVKVPPRQVREGGADREHTAPPFAAAPFAGLSWSLGVWALEGHT